MKFYTLNLRVAEDALGETITAVTPLIVAQRVTLQTILPYSEVITIKNKKRRTGTEGRELRSPQGRKRGERLAPHEHRPSILMLDALRTGHCSLQELIDVITPEQYAPATAKSRLSDMVRSGHVEKYMDTPTRTMRYRLGPVAASQ